MPAAGRTITDPDEGARVTSLIVRKRDAPNRNLPQKNASPNAPAITPIRPHTYIPLLPPNSHSPETQPPSPLQLTSAGKGKCRPPFLAPAIPINTPYQMRIRWPRPTSSQDWMMRPPYAPSRLSLRPYLGPVVFEASRRCRARHRSANPRNNIDL